ncbi:MAG: LuxR C-terminal-related transcriptional regulator [Tepidisphaeraceae bacterium]|jgi:DNA-binding CsgD family transcriptional regulator
MAARPRSGSRLGDVRALIRASGGLQPMAGDGPVCTTSVRTASDQGGRLGCQGGSRNTDGGSCGPAELAPSNGVARKRRLIAMFCKLLGEQLVEGGNAVRSLGGGPLSPRQRQTLELLLAGNAEKQIASRLAISRHTVHVYVKSLYKRFGVCSRAELLARWVQH